MLPMMDGWWLVMYICTIHMDLKPACLPTLWHIGLILFIGTNWSCYFLGNINGGWAVLQYMSCWDWVGMKFKTVAIPNPDQPPWLGSIQSGWCGCIWWNNTTTVKWNSLITESPKGRARSYSCAFHVLAVFPLLSTYILNLFAEFIEAPVLFHVLFRCVVVSVERSY